MLYFLLLSVIILFAASFIMCHRDILAPPVLMCIVFILSISFAVLNIKAWGIDYQFITYLIMITGILSFILFSIPFYCIPKSKHNDMLVGNSRRDMPLLLCDKKILWFCLILDVFITIYYFKEVYRISLIGGNPLGIEGMFTYYRMYTASNADAEAISTFGNQLLKLGRAFGYISIFILAYNSQIKFNISRDRLLIPFVILTIFQNIIGGGRGYILWIICVAFTTLYITNMKKYDWQKRLNLKYIKKGAIALILVLIIFYLLKYVVRIENSVNSLIDYISYYAGGSIQLFNLYIENPPQNSNLLWGQESFRGIYTTLDTFGLFNLSDYYATNSNLEFRLSNGVRIGNVYGAFRRYYNDFGISGVIILQGISAIFFNSFYLYIKKMKVSKSKFFIFLYAYFLYHVYEISIDDALFKSFLSFNMFTTIIILYFVYFLFVNIRINGLKVRLTNK